MNSIIDGGNSDTKPSASIMRCVFVSFFGFLDKNVVSKVNFDFGCSTFQEARKLTKVISLLN